MPDQVRDVALVPAAVEDCELLPGPHEERGRGALARCATLMLSLVEVDLHAIGQEPKHYLLEHAVHGDGRDEQRREYTQRIRQQRRNRREKP